MSQAQLSNVVTGSFPGNWIDFDLLNRSELEETLVELETARFQYNELIVDAVRRMDDLGGTIERITDCLRILDRMLIDGRGRLYRLRRREHFEQRCLELLKEYERPVRMEVVETTETQ